MKQSGESEIENDDKGSGRRIARSRRVVDVWQTNVT